MLPRYISNVPTPANLITLSVERAARRKLFEILVTWQFWEASGALTPGLSVY